jgi:hypothetical protein
LIIEFIIESNAFSQSLSEEVSPSQNLGQLLKTITCPCRLVAIFNLVYYLLKDLSGLGADEDVTDFVTGCVRQVDDR